MRRSFDTRRAPSGMSGWRTGLRRRLNAEALRGQALATAACMRSRHSRLRGREMCRLLHDGYTRLPSRFTSPLRRRGVAAAIDVHGGDAGLHAGTMHCVRGGSRGMFERHAAIVRRRRLERWRDLRGRRTEVRERRLLPLRQREQVVRR